MGLKCGFKGAGWKLGKASGQPWLNRHSPFCSPLLACVTLREHVVTLV